MRVADSLKVTFSVISSYLFSLGLVTINFILIVNF